MDEEAKAVFNCLNTFVNMVETDPSVAEQVRCLKCTLAIANTSLLTRVQVHASGDWESALSAAGTWSNADC